MHRGTGNPRVCVQNYVRIYILLLLLGCRCRNVHFPTRKTDFLKPVNRHATMQVYEQRADNNKVNISKNGFVLHGNWYVCTYNRVDVPSIQLAQLAL